MTDLAGRTPGQARLIGALVAVFVLAGALAYLQMNRQENPSFPYRAAIVTVAFPGAGPARIERLVARPLEEEIAEIAAVDTIDTTLRQGMAVFTIQLGDEVYDTDTAWDRVRVAMDDAARDYPAGVGEAQLDDRIIDASLMVLAVNGDAPPRILGDAAKTLRRHLLGVDGVAATELHGDPGRQVTITIDDAAMDRYGVSPAGIAADIGANNRVTRGGTLRLAGASVHLDPATDFDDIDAIRDTAIGLPDGGTLPLSALAQVHQSEAVPARGALWHDGNRGVGVEIIAERGVNVVALGERLRDAVDAIRPMIAPLEIREMFYQPAQTERRLDDLSLNLLISVAIILLVLFVFMGLRLGVVVAMLLPLVTLTTIALYALGGGILHQIAIIGLVVALGILVDNAIVMSEDVQRRLNAGDTPAAAAAGAIRELAGPLFAATGTTLAAFVPMLLSEGNTADFTRALPITIMLSLTVSYLFAVTVTPLVCQFALRRRAATGPGLIDRLGAHLARLTLRFPTLLIVAGGLVMAAALASQIWLDEEFFPPADRTAVVIDLSLPEGAHIDRTEASAQRLARALRGHAGVRAIHTFVGDGGPTFFYNLRRAPASPQLARLVVITDTLARNSPIIDFAERYAADHLPAADVVARKLAQGPMVDAPIEIRIYNPDPAALVRATEQVFSATRALPGARDVRHDLGTGVPSVDYRIENAVARAFGVTPIDVAQALQRRTDGLVVGQYRAGDDPMPIKLRSPEGERTAPTALDTALVYGDPNRPIPLMQAATPHLTIQPGAIRRHDQRRVGHVLSELQPGAVYSEVLDPLRTRIGDLDLPPGTTLAYGGNAEESGKANAALFRAAPLGVALLLFFLLVQFNSFTRVMLVLLTALFALVGVFPGLLLLGIPFGFMPLLGLIALTGIVVNNAIVLIDTIDRRLASGAGLETAIADAVRRRTRPIILTTATTIAGLLPLALSPTTLWPPMAWPIITGLLASTLLTLLVLPAVCRLVLRPPRRSRRRAGHSALLVACVIGAGLATAQPAHATERSAHERSMDLIEVLHRARTRPEVERTQHEADAAGAVADRARRAGRYPTVSMQAFAAYSDRVARIDSSDLNGPDFDGIDALPPGSAALGQRGRSGAALELRQPVIDLAQQRYAAPAAEASARAAASTLDRTRVRSMVHAADAYTDALATKARLSAGRRLIANLAARAERVAAQRESGRALRSEMLAVDYAHRRAQRQHADRINDFEIARRELGRAVGRDSPVRPRPIEYDVPPVTANEEILMARALARRRDMAALVARIRSAELAVRRAGARRLPTLDAVAEARYNKGNPFLPEHENRISAEIRWRPFAGGTIAAREGEAEARLSALRARRIKLRRDIKIQVGRALRRLENARDGIELARLGVDSAEATRDTRAAQLAGGRARMDDLLEAEATLAERRAEARIARLRTMSAWIALQGAVGNDDIIATLSRTADRR
ncbi:acriflavin resistance protein [Salinisphaera orenii MK-B5]|uniref:Acriflavin resistance protein n=1 Tax=Salinisphaera orenii MK-B5 TaxID=856730 RepID=A0A423PFC8_9GAMM|nr:efflux RND transporter permease subunit [Salinisphaera orenii]ROO24243.1 acriflavin resistance protein [Salinisphaera orenii MK-B5]